METVRKMKDAINRVFNEEGGIHLKGISDEQLATYAMQKVKEFARTGGKVLKASLMIGRQPNKRMVDGAGDFVALDAGEDHPNSHEMEEDYDSAVYILNEKTQV